MSGKSWTLNDERDSKFIGILLFVAKISSRANRNARNRFVQTSEYRKKEAEEAAREMAALITTSLQMFPTDGEMETQVLAFAKSLGYEVEQHKIPQGAKIRQ